MTLNGEQIYSLIISLKFIENNKYFDMPAHMIFDVIYDTKKLCSNYKVYEQAVQHIDTSDPDYDTKYNLVMNKEITFELTRISKADLEQYVKESFIVDNLELILK